MVDNFDVENEFDSSSNNGVTIDGVGGGVGVEGVGGGGEVGVEGVEGGGGEVEGVGGVGGEVGVDRVVKTVNSSDNGISTLNEFKSILLNEINNESWLRDIIVLYCPEKVGSSSIVSSIRLYASDKYIVFHTHEDKIADIFNLTKTTINVRDILSNDDFIEPDTKKHIRRQIYIIDIFRTPIERKISFFFQKISEVHFNNSETNISNYPIQKIIKRFNDIFPYLTDVDYFNDIYPYMIDGSCELDKEITISSFDFEKKYIHIKKSSIHYIKLRLNDSKYWGDILTDILKTKIRIIHNYDTGDKGIGDMYKKFKYSYKIPYNFYKLIENEPSLNIYLTLDEKKEYLKKWFDKISKPHIPFTIKEYETYILISDENKFYCANTSNKHYADDGCLCTNCKDKRKYITDNLELGQENKIDVWVRHEYNDTYDSKILLKLFLNKDKNKNKNKFTYMIINLINL